MEIGRRLDAGNTGGAVRIGDTVRRTAGLWTPSVHALLDHLHDVGVDRAPRAFGFDDEGREILSYLPGETVGSSRPWPEWVHSDDALLQVAEWLRDYHHAVADFRPRSITKAIGHVPGSCFALPSIYLGIPDMRDSPSGTSLTGNSSPLGAARSLRW